MSAVFDWAQVCPDDFASPVHADVLCVSARVYAEDAKMRALFTQAGERS